MNNMFAAMLAAAQKKENAFTLTVNITSANYQYGVKPYWDTGGGCTVDWGDGTTTTATSSGTLLIHTYAAEGVYVIRVVGGMYRFGACTTNPAALIACNGNWNALGNLTSGDVMFYQASNALLDFADLPPGLTTALSMFYGCEVAVLPLTALPDGLTGGANMFFTCNAATMNIQRLPAGLTTATYMFYNCRRMTADLDAWVANNPNGWASLTNVSFFMRNAGSQNSPGSVTGSRSAFQAKCPEITDWTTGAPFYGTNTTE